MFYDHEIEIDVATYQRLKFDPGIKDAYEEFILLEYCKGKKPSSFTLDDASVIQEIQPEPKIKKSKAIKKPIEPLDKGHLKDMQARAKYHSHTLEIKEGYIALTNGYADSPEIKTWKNKIFNKMTPDTLTSFLKKSKEI